MLSKIRDVGKWDYKRDVSDLSLLVIAKAVFGKEREIAVGGGTEAKAVNRVIKPRLSFLDAMHLTSKYLLVITCLNPKFLRFLGYGRAGEAQQELRLYFEEAIEDARNAITVGKPHDNQTDRNDLLYCLIKSSTVAALDASSKLVAPLSTREIMGNLFVFLLGGYETTHSAIVYTCVILALHPQLQIRMRNEILLAVTKASSEGRDELTYEKDFQQLEYCFAVIVS